MALPKYSYPVYTLTLPSTGKEVKYRPFLVKDEKNLLLAAQSEENRTMYDTLGTVIASCIVSGAKIEDLSVFDLEYVFTQLRCKSIGEEVELIFTCQNKECANKHPHTFKIDPVVIKDPRHTQKIELFDNVGAMLKYPGPDELRKIRETDLTNPDEIIALIANCVDYIYDDEQVFYAKDQSKKEMIHFIENLPRQASDKIKMFFETMPKLIQTIKCACPKCQTESEYVIEGIENFF